VAVDRNLEGRCALVAQRRFVVLVAVQMEVPLSYLDKTIHYDEFIRWGAPTLLRVSPEELRQAHFKTNERVTVSYVIDALVHHPGHIVWSLARHEVLDEATLHALGAELSAYFLSRLRQEGVYIDFRTQRLSDAKTRFANGEISLGELATARTHGFQAWHDVALHGDPKASAGATAALAFADPDLRKGILKAARVMYTTHPHMRDFIQLAATVRCFLATRSPRRRAS
jgi:hypothetical protein